MRNFTAAAAALAVALVAIVSCGETQKKPEDLGQGWSEADRDWWYTVTQGSRFIPRVWAQALEAPDSEQALFTDATFERFNYLLYAKSTRNAYGLPVGFAVDKGDKAQVNAGCKQFPKMCAGGVLKQEWIGLNCAACHTNEVTFGEHKLRIDGGSTLADFEGFFALVRASLLATRDDADKFDRFAKKVLGATPAPDKIAALKDQLGELLVWETQLFAQSGAISSPGFARLDAQGHILNKVAAIVGASNQLRDYPADAPASYPFIWNAPQHKVVQWNGIASNGSQYSLGGKPTNIGALARNVGEVVGVFAHVDATQPDLIGGFKSSVRTGELIAIERLLGRLRSPKWPAEFGALDQLKVKRGKELYVQHCQSCHAILPSDDLQSPAKEEMQSLAEARTDIWLACNTYLSEAKAGALTGLKVGIITGPAIAAQTKTAVLLKRTILSVIVGERGELVAGAINDVLRPRSGVSALVVPGPPVEYLPGVADPLKKARAETCLKGSVGAPIADTGLGYKARPLNGAWATAPYLHNGSVPSLYDLLLPARVEVSAPAGQVMPPWAEGMRPETFYVGSREFDPKKAGFVYDQPIGVPFRVFDDAGQPILGNYNSGHNYATNLDEADRWALVEYLKTL